MHKSIIHSRCPLLFNEFKHSHELHETKPLLVLNDVKVEDFTSFLKYLYTGTFPSKKEHPLLSVLAYQYKLSMLQKLCQNPSDGKLRADAVLRFEKDMRRLMENKIHADVQVEAVSPSKSSKKVLHLHKPILIARSEWFAQKLLEKNTSETVVVIEEMEPQILETIVEYLYTDTISCTIPEVLSGVAVWGEKMNLARLKELSLLVKENLQ